MPERAGLDAYPEAWLVAFAAKAPPGERPGPAGLVAREVRSGRVLRLGHDGLRSRRSPPFPTGPESLFVAYEASGALGCHLALGWPPPARVLDLHAESRCRTAGLRLPHGAGLLGALTWHGLDALDAAGEARAGRLALRESPGAGAQPGVVLDACEAVVRALGRLLGAMAPELDLPHALLRGRYMGAVARIERAGVPIDVPTLGRLRAGWESIKDRLVRDIDARFGVFDSRAFRPERWEAWLARVGLPWPRLGSGRLALDEETFREMARAHPDVTLVRELRLALSGMDLFGRLAVGSDGRNRVPLGPFGSKTGRNQPPASRSIFGPATWLRGLIRPEPGRPLGYVDWCQQEFGIAAALSGDPAMRAAYRSGDPYLAFGRQAGQIPVDGTKATHGRARERFKACSLGALYSMGEAALAQRIGRPVAEGRELLRLHRQTYPTYWAWSDGAEAHGLLLGRLHTVFGWEMRAGPDANARSLRNFPMQANGAEMLRLACCLATERGVTVCAPVHDALLVEGPADAIDEVVERARRAMAEASGVVLSGFPLRTAARVVRWPERYMDERGRAMWERVMRLLSDGPATSRPARVIRLHRPPRPVR